MKKNLKKMEKNIKKTVSQNKKPLIIAGISAGAVALVAGLGKAFVSIKKSAKAQH